MANSIQLPPFPPAEKERIVAQIRGHAPVLNLLGVELTELEPGHCRMHLPFKRDITRGDGVVQGGIVTTIADTSIAHAALAALFPDQSTSTIELKMNFIRAARTDLDVEAWLIHKGRTTIVGESAVTDADGKLVAKCLASVMVMNLRSPFAKEPA